MSYMEHLLFVHMGNTMDFFVQVSFVFISDDSSLYFHVYGNL